MVEGVARVDLGLDLRQPAGGAGADGLLDAVAAIVSLEVVEVVPAGQVGRHGAHDPVENDAHPLEPGGRGGDPEQLDAIAQNGGTDFDRYLAVRDRLELESVLHELVASTIDCQFDFAPEMGDDNSGWKINYSATEFYLDGELVPRDPGCAADLGWDWLVDNEEVVFCHQACMAIGESGSSIIEAEFECIPDIVPI